MHKESALPGITSPSPIRTLRVCSCDTVTFESSNFSEYRIVTSSPNSTSHTDSRYRATISICLYPVQSAPIVANSPSTSTHAQQRHIDPLWYDDAPACTPSGFARTTLRKMPPVPSKSSKSSRSSALIVTIASSVCYVRARASNVRLCASLVFSYFVVVVVECLSRLENEYLGCVA